MRSTASLLTLLFLQAALGKDIWEDIAENHDETTGDKSSETSADLGTLRKTRNYGYYWPGRSGAQTNTADRILDQLLRQCNGDISEVLSSIERRFNLRVRANADLQTRLDAIVAAANAGLSFSGYGNFRSVVNSVADRLSAMIRASSLQSAQGNPSGQWSWSSSWSASSGSGQRPNVPQGSGAQQTRPSQGSDWSSQTSGSSSGQASSWSYAGPTWQESPDYWTEPNPSDRDPWTGPQPMVHIPTTTTPVYGSRPLFVNSEDDWPRRTNTRSNR